ncbi:SusC/RagA family TonB-linked outer membrane protein [Niabella drilacis]|uniref:TonB-linked outer membrane protein, SusC/RagA family n=1 Tax=Niabella drilacis (strain DSM 25811 / CCM 8410 / CCUG 62505 / LMG 26954 / E90) TaxID=1285928 RepID=A0A1G6PU96_NIADE|nr:SusC/RagA family TonB-linked outer membrane protein [Niabella drilacis]SDC83244.1 TonB-linked outer membrane protein, SusC/RagA family [Niabella drilacis]
MKKRHLLLVFFTTLLCCGNLLAQVKRTITGSVTDPDGRPIPGASIIEKSTSNGVAADEQGRFTINVTGNATLDVSAAGFEPIEQKTGNSNEVTIILKSVEKAEDEVVVTALGIKRDKRSVGYAVQQVKGSDITIAAPVDVAQGLAGKVAGLNISTSNGLGNASSRIVIRGNNSLNGNNQPLIVIDGAIVDNTPIAQSATTGTDISTTRDWGNYLSYLNMDNIESVSVLKGPNAAALYGARGANGVLLITSKKGLKKKGLGIDYNFTTNFSNVYRFQDVQNEYGGGFAAGLWSANPELPKTKNGEYYLPTLYGGSSYATGGTGIGGYHGSIPGGFYTADIFSWFGASSSWGPKLNGQMVRWWDGQLRPYSPQPDNREAYYRQANETTHNVSFSSGSELGTLRLAATRTDATAVVPNTNYNNTNFSLGSHVIISRILNADVNVAYNQNYRLNTPEIGSNNSWSKFSVYGMSREYKPLEFDHYKNADGSKIDFGAAYPQQEYSRDLFWYFNERNSRLNRDELISTVKLNADITPWLNAFVRTSANLVAEKFETINNTTSGYNGVTGGGYSKELNKNKFLNTDVMVTAHKDNLFFQDFNASASAMYNSYSNKSTGVAGSNGGTFIVPGIYSLGNIIDADRADKNKYNTSERRYEVKSEGVLGILNLSYNNYLYLNLTARNDWNSTLSPDQNSTFYPSGDLSFVFSDAFKMRSSVFSYGKLRLSYGKSANASDPYLLGANYDVSSYGGQPTYSFPNVLRPDKLGFQTSTSTEIGTSLGFLNDRINLDFSFYNILSKNQILAADIAPSSGVNSITFNSGELRNRGFDFTINAGIIKSADFGWNLILNGAKNNNFVVSLADGIKELRIGDIFGDLGVFMKVSPGEKYGAIYGTDFLRDDNGNKIITNVKDASGNVVGTLYKATTKPVIIGNASPKLTGGVGNTFRYKNFSLYGLVDFKVGGDIYSFDHSTAMGSGISPATLKERDGGGLPYTFPDGTTANVGVIMDGYNVDDGKMNDRVVNPIYKYAGSYTGWTHLNRPRSLSVFENTWVKMRELALSYTLPAAIASKTKVFQSLSLSLIGRNLFYFHTTLPDHLNPEAIMGTGNAQGLQWSAFPSIRTLGFSLKAQF